jgi:hypothetical protein
VAANIVHSATAEIGDLLSSLKNIQGKVSEARALINLMGWELPPGIEDIGLAALDLGDFLAKLDAVIGASDAEWEDELTMAGRISDLTLALTALVQQIETLATELPVKLASFGDYVDKTNIHKELPTRLFAFLVVTYLSDKSPLVFAILHLIDVIDYPYFPADPSIFQIEHIRPVLHYEHFKTLFTNPTGLAQEAYGWNTPNFAANRFLGRLNLLFQTMGMRSRLQVLDAAAEQAWTDGTPGTDPVPQLITYLHEQRGALAGFQLGLSIFGARPTAEGASDGGFGIVPIVRGQAQGSVPFFRFDNTSIDLSANGDLLRRLAIILRPEQDLDVRFARGMSETVTGRFALGFRRGIPDGASAAALSFPGGSTLKVQQFVITGGMEIFAERPAESFLEVALLECTFNLSMNDADSFLQDTVSQNNISAPFDVRVGWRSEQGIYFHGSSGLLVSIPVHRDAGALTINSLTVGLKATDAGLSLETSIDGSLTLGPLKVTVQRLGMETDVSFEGGNLGFLGLSPHFKPPNGLGLSINGGGFTGGGFLDYEPDQARYVGVLELEYQDRISLKAVGLLNTRLPNGQRGYSLLIVISSEFTPIQLGLGFTLNGVGGLIGLNRTVNVERLRTGLRDATLGSVLFPQNIIANASRIISDLTQVFPPQTDRFIFGPMARIGWGSPTLITIDLGLIVEVPDPVRVIILGVIKATLPDDRLKLLQLQVNFLGVIDFGAERLSFDARLYDSKLLSFPLTGDMAVRLSWGADPNFLLTVGGFHPSYEPPPLNLPTLRRLSLQLTSGDNPRLTLETYFAITSNTVQFGAKVELLAKAGSFSVYGFLSFDVLFQFNPFFFTASIKAKLALRAGSSEIASISLDFTLEGPTPWHIKGTAKLKICWFLTIKVRFDKTFGEERNTRLDDVAVLPLLRTALADKGNWEAQPPPNRHLLVSVKQIETTELIVQPFGVLAIQQKVVPLNIDIQRFGSQKPADASRFSIQGVSIGVGGDAQSQAISSVSEMFAPAQFFELADTEKLARKSFEHYESGVKLIASEAFDGDYAVRREVAYELFYIDDQRNLLQQSIPQKPDFQAFDHWTTRGAIANSPLSASNARTSLLALEAVRFGDEGFAVVNANDLRPVAADALTANESAAHRLRDALIQNNPALENEILVVPIFEVNRV